MIDAYCVRHVSLLLVDLYTMNSKGYLSLKNSMQSYRYKLAQSSTQSYRYKLAQKQHAVV